MIISVEELKTLVDIDETFSDSKLAMMLDGLEMLIRKKTNNHFHIKNVRFEMTVQDGQLVGSFDHLNVGDTIEVSASEYNHNVVAYITAITGNVITLNKALQPEDGTIIITKVVYPPDVIQGVVNLMDYDIHNRDRVGVKSESLSRHSVTYYDGGDQQYGYPSSLMDFITPYCKARF